MEPNGKPTTSFYNYLIRPDRSATRQLENLCLGLAKVIVSPILKFLVGDLTDMCNRVTLTQASILTES